MSGGREIDRQSRLWRTVLLALCALAALLTLHETIFYIGDTGVSVGRQQSSFVYRIGVAPAGPAYAAGLRTGDRIDVRLLTVSQRVAQSNPAPGQTVVFPVIDSNGKLRKTVPVTAIRAADTDIWLALASHFWFIAFALALVWRRPTDKPARVLAILLLSLVFGAVLQNVPTRWPLLTATLYLSFAVPYCGSSIVLAFYTRFFGASTPLRRLLLGATILTAVAWAANAILVTLAYWMAWSVPSAVTTGTVPAALAYLLPALPILCVLAAVPQTRGEERQRLLWVTLPNMLFMLGDIVFLATSAALPGRLETLLISVEEFLMPLGLTYATFNRRVIDLGFVLNRAAIFSVVSIVLVGTFVLVEWALGEWLKDASHATGLAFSAGLALLLGISIRFVHARVEHILDRVFFRKRYENERALRDFAHEAAYVTNGETLLARTSAVLERHAGAAFARVLLDDANGTYGGIEENDRAIVALRARHRPVDLHSADSALPGEWAYPMIARGKLIGVLALAAKRSGEAYDPDESAAIAEVATGVAAALEVLQFKNRDAGAMDRFEALLDRFDGICAQLDAART